jgi:hypothetical protein
MKMVMWMKNGEVDVEWGDRVILLLIGPSWGMKICFFALGGS